MGRLIYAMIQSLDGYVADAAGRFDWAEPDESVHTFANQLQRSVAMNLYGRRMYEVMSAWETLGTHGDEPAYIEAVRRAVARVRQSRLLDDPGLGGRRSHPDRARVRTRRRPTDEGRARG